MNEPQSNQAKSIKPNQVLISGRVQNTRLYDKKHFHHITLPAADSFSSPAQVEVSAKTRFAEKGEDVTVLCTVGGYARIQDVTDKSTGEKNKQTIITVRLELVE